MPSYTTAQRGQISQFVSFTQAKESIAAKFLKNHNWTVDAAVDAFIPMPKKAAPAGTGAGVKKMKAPPKKSKQRANHDHDGSFYNAGNTNSTAPQGQQALSKIFDKYRDDPKLSPDKINIDGAQTYLTDLGVALDDIALLCLCELLQCPSIGEFDREPFITGWQSASSTAGSGALDTIAKQSAFVASSRKRLPTDGPYFKRVYRYAFTLAKPPGQKSVPVDSALEFWAMFFSESKGGVEWNGRDEAWLDEWLQFYERKGKRLVNKDLWNMVYELMVKTKEPGGESLEWWNEDGAWPMAVDEFVGYIKGRRTGGETMDTT